MTTEPKQYRHDPRYHENVSDMKEHETAYLEHEARAEAERILARLAGKSSAFRRLVALHFDNLTKKERGVK